MNSPEPNTLAQRALVRLIYAPGYIGRSAYRKLCRRFRENTENDFLAKVENLTSADICIDLGANIGEYTTMLAATGATVYAFEPDPVSFEILKENTAHLPNVKLMPYAAGVFDGTVQFYPDPDRSGNRICSSVTIKNEKTDPSFGTEVEQLDFPAFLQTLPQKVSLIKMDIEGAEWAILEKLLTTEYLNRFDALFVETHEGLDPSKFGNAQKYARFCFQTKTPYVNIFWP